MTLLAIIERSIDYYFSCLPRQKPAGLRVSEVCLIAHRGAHDKVKRIRENTDAAFARALDLGCWGIEFDVHPTRDNVLMVNHDPTLKRLWNKDIAIRELTFQALRQRVPEIPSLAEVVERYSKKMHLFIELKQSLGRAAKDALKNNLQELVPCEDYHLISLNESFFTSLSSFQPEAMLLVAAHNNVRQFCEKSLQKQYGGVLGHYLLLNDSNIRKLQQANQLVGVGQVNSKYGLYRELQRGIQLIFSNNIALLKQCLNELSDV
ncbi:glycerophosphodiester phosphodiesterase [Legionella fairfieldensis]|uniref:glycerophosphodiester phosphodiesterase n=1 Tax=Legionella fairfieldensis TaxID=45064 RepID=UPI000561075B|nr:glycerophosphodiester phosphodiesterase family protein [Legionella fairfieldensis]